MITDIRDDMQKHMCLNVECSFVIITNLLLAIEYIRIGCFFLLQTQDRTTVSK